MAEIGKRNDRAFADAQELAQHNPRAFGRLDGLREDRDVENARRIVAQIRVGVALHDRQAARHAGVHVLLAEFQPARVGALFRHQMFQQRAVAAADVEHARAARGSSRQLPQGRGAARARWAGVSKFMRMPLAAAAAPMKPRMVAKSSGSSSRNASCPRSVLISTKLTLAPAAFSACATRLFSGVGNSQSRGERNDAEARLGAAEGLGQHAAVFGREIEIVHRPRHVEIRIGIETIDEAHALMPQIEFDLEIGVEAERQPFAVLQHAAEFALQRGFGKIRDVRRHARDRQAPWPGWCRARA